MRKATWQDAVFGCTLAAVLAAVLATAANALNDPRVRCGVELVPPIKCDPAGVKYNRAPRVCVQS